jgi:hypothetical protein
VYYGMSASYQGSRPVLPKVDAKTLFRAGLGSGAAVALGSMLAYMPAVPLYFVKDVEELGRYALVSYAVTAVTLLISQLQQSHLHEWAHMFRTDPSTLRVAISAFIQRYSMASVCAGIALVVVGITALDKFGSEFRYDTLELLLLAMSLVFLPSILAWSGVILVVNSYGAYVLGNFVAVLVGLLAMTALWRGFTVADSAAVLLVTTIARWFVVSFIGHKVLAAGE